MGKVVFDYKNLSLIKGVGPTFERKRETYIECSLGPLQEDIDITLLYVLQM